MACHMYFANIIVSDIKPQSYIWHMKLNKH